MTTGLIAITGATGFVGSHLTAGLAGVGYPLRMFVRRHDDRLLGLGELVEGCLEDNIALDQLCSGADTVIHLAGMLNAYRHDEFHRVNVAGTRNLIEASKRARVRRFIYVSSLAAREPGLSAYGHSKRCAEEFLASSAGDLSWVALRPPAVYGPGDRATLPLISQLSRRVAFLPARKNMRLSLLYVGDLTSAIESLTKADAPAGGIFELHDGAKEGYSWDDIAEAAARVTGSKPRVVFLPRRLMQTVAAGSELVARSLNRPPVLSRGKVRELYHDDWVCRSNLLDRQTGWCPRTPFAAGYGITLDWYRQKGWL